MRNLQVIIGSPGRHALENVYRCLSAREAKWLTRLILKDYRPVVLDPQLIYRCCDGKLPLMLKVQDDFAVAAQALQRLKGKDSRAQSTLANHNSIVAMKPRIGVKVGRQAWFKGRSIKHCLDIGCGRMSIEEKLDGEYCQIHVVVADGKPQVQIFSKSGKDSTEDRHKICE